MIIDKKQYQLHIETMGNSREEVLPTILAEMLEFDIDRVKTLLVMASPPHESTIAALQGEAQAYKRYLKALKG